MSSDIIFFNTENGLTKIEPHLSDGTFWLSQMEIAELFQTTRQNIKKHINAIFAEGELDEKVVSNYNLIFLSEKIISIFNELVNQIKTETVFIRELSELVPLIKKWYFAESELPILPQNLKSWCQACTGVVATIHNFTIFYNEYGLINRAPENRLACMTNAKDRFYEDLENLQIEEQYISHLLNTL